MKIYLIDSHPLMREGLAIQLRRIDPLCEIFEASKLSELASLTVVNGAPDLICTELDLPDSSGMGTVSQIKAVHPHAPLVVFTSASAALLEDIAVSAGADVFIQKTTASIEIAGMLRALVKGESELDTPMGIGKMSKRQAQLIRMLDQGLSNRDIAEKLGISEHTVKVHLWRLFRKIGVNSRTQVLHFARNTGLI